MEPEGGQKGGPPGKDKDSPNGLKGIRGGGMN